MIFVRIGNKTPADILIFFISDYNVNNSFLTNKFEPQKRTKNNNLKSPLEALNIMFNNTLVISGKAYEIVIRIKNSIVLGHIARLAINKKKIKSSLAHEIDNFIKVIAVIAIATAIIFFNIIFPVNNNNTSLAINFTIGIFIAWVPKNLPVTITMFLIIAAKKMAN
jgi:sodium/potassium-transporting ATPase subunit alpha